MKTGIDRKFIVGLVCVLAAAAIFFVGSCYGKTQLRAEYEEAYAEECKTQAHFEMSRRLDALEETYSCYARAVEDYLHAEDRAAAGEAFSLLCSMTSGFRNADSDLLDRYRHYAADDAAAHDELEVLLFGTQAAEYDAPEGLLLGAYSAESDLSKFDDDTLSELCALYDALSECCHRFEGTYGYCFFYLDYDDPSEEYFTAKAEVSRLLMQLDRITQ